MVHKSQQCLATTKDFLVVRFKGEFQEVVTCKDFLQVQIAGRSYADRISAR